MSEWKTGDRVRLKASFAKLIKQPYRDFALKGRPATLAYSPTNTVGAYHLTFDGRHWKPVEIVFDSDSAFERI